MGIHAIRVISTSDGGLRVERFDPQSGQFVLDMSRLTRALQPHPEDDELDEAAFEAEIARLGRERATTEPPASPEPSDERRSR
jgi:hypothetical protein